MNTNTTELPVLIKHQQARQTCYIGMERGDTKANFQETFNDGLRSMLTARVDSIFQTLFGGNKELVKFEYQNGLGKTSINWLDRNPYLSIGDVTVFVPVGLNVNMLEYVETLEESVEYLANINDGLLIPLRALMGKYVNEPDLLNSRKVLPLENKTKTEYSQKRLDKLISDISECFDPRQRTDKEKFKKVYSRNQDLNITSERVLQLQDNLNRINHTNVRECMKTIHDYATNIAEQINVESLDVNDKIVDMLTDRMYLAAAWVEFYGHICQKATVVSKALEDTRSKIEDLSK